MDKLLETLITSGPTVIVMLWIFSQLRSDVKEVMNNVLRLLEKCMDNADNDGSNVKDSPLRTPLDR